MTEAREAPAPLALSGLETLRGIIAAKSSGRGIGKTLNFRIVEAEEGFVALEGEPTEAVLNPLGMVHGGWMLTLIDSATALAAWTTLPAGVGYTSVETKGNFVRGLRANSGLVRTEGRVIAKGRTLITAEAKLTDPAGKLVAHGTATIMVVRP